MRSICNNYTFLVLIIAIAACIVLVVVIKKKKKEKYDFEQESPPIALNPVHGAEEDEKKYNLYDVPKKEIADKC